MKRMDPKLPFEQALAQQKGQKRSNANRRMLKEFEHFRCWELFPVFVWMVSLAKEVHAKSLLDVADECPLLACRQKSLRSSAENRFNQEIEGRRMSHFKADVNNLKKDKRPQVKNPTERACR
jgi:hypothetical protein